MRPAPFRFKNREHMTFDDAGGKADQEFDVVQDDEGRIQYPTKYSNQQTQLPVQARA